MKKFHTGDRVRVISERNMEGTVTGRDKRDNVLVMMTDGFEQTFPDRELALVNTSAENAAFTPAPSMVTRAQAGPAKAAEARSGVSNIGGVVSTPAAPARKGIFLGLSAPIAGSNARELVMLNNSDLVLALVVGYNRENRFQVEKITVALPKQATTLAEIPLKHLQDRPTFQVWAHAAQPGQLGHPAPIHSTWHLPADFADRPLEPAPVTGRPMLFTELEAGGPAPAPIAEQKVLGALPGGKLVQTSSVAGGQLPVASTGAKTLSGKAIADAMMAPKAAQPAPANPPATGNSQLATEVDLHIEQLSLRAGQMASDEILQTQLRAFEEAFDNAQATGNQYLTLIHGISNPALRTAIHRRLSSAAQNGLIANFEDYQKERLGYNATRVKFY